MASRWPGLTAAGTVADSHGIPFSFHPGSTGIMETNDDPKLNNFVIRFDVFIKIISSMN
jgi:hypothetical protein